ncbi:MAG: RidA family protein [Burkholderiales bacterium]
MRSSTSWQWACVLAAGTYLSGCAAAPPQVEYFREPGSQLPFSTAVRVGDVVYLSGQIGNNADGSIPQEFADQARVTMDNIASAAKQAGVGMGSIFKCLVMIQDMSRWGEFNKVYVAYFDTDRLPARSAFGASGLALGAQLEVECLAVAPARRARR